MWRNAATDATGSQTRAGVETYDDLYADTRAWARQGLVDYIAPQDYWSRTLAVAPYDAVARWWADVALASPRTNVYLGEATYKVAVADEYGSDTAWTRSAELPSHMAAVDAVNAARPSMLAGGGAVKGHIFFSAADMAADRLGSTSTITRTRYSKPALTPTTPWLDAGHPSPLRVVRRGNTLTLVASSDAAQFVVYRVPASLRNVRPCQLADMRYAIAVTSSRTVTDAALGTSFGRYTWLVTAVDRASNESDAQVVR